MNVGRIFRGVLSVILAALLLSFLPRLSANAEEIPREWNLYFGLLHAHTGVSDGEGTVEEAFRHAAQVEGLDFFAVTDHSNSFDNDTAGSIAADGSAISEAWAAGKAAAAAVTNADFVGIFGYEMTWRDTQDLGHINTFNTPGWQSINQEGFDTLESYYELLTTVPGAVSQFNHPGRTYGTFLNFRNYSARYDAVVQLLEVGSENGYTAYEYYELALAQGWHVAPTNNQNNHYGNWGDASQVRTVVLANQLTEESLYDAMRNHRVYATEDCDLSIYYLLDGQIMGSILHGADDPVITVALEDPTNAVGLVEVVAEGTVLDSRQVDTSAENLTFSVPGGYRYYYLRISRGGRIIAVTAPVWVEDPSDVGINSFYTDRETVIQGQEFHLTLELFNDEAVDISVENMEFSVNGEVIHTVSQPGTLRAFDRFSYTLSLTCAEPGATVLRAAATVCVDGELRTLERILTLYVQSPQTANGGQKIRAIQEVYSGGIGTVYRVRGYVTAGNSCEYNTFPDTVYLQDDTGGIAVVNFPDIDVQIGTHLEVVGALNLDGSNAVLELIRYELTGEDSFAWEPKILSNASAMDYAAHGGELLQVEGQVVSVTRTNDGKGVSKLMVKDENGDASTVLIEEGIASGKYGTNTLASQIQEGQTVRAMGLLYLDGEGHPMLRVRNCDEVVRVASSTAAESPAKESSSAGASSGRPSADPSNPKTGDLFRRILEYIR